MALVGSDGLEVVPPSLPSMAPPRLLPRAETSAPSRWDRGSSAAWVALLMIGDLAAMAVSFGYASALGPSEGRPFPPLAVVSWVLAMAFGGAYDVRRFGSRCTAFVKVASAATWFIAGFTLVLLVEPGLSRRFLLLAVFSAMVISVVVHQAGENWLRRRRAAGGCPVRVVILGDDDHDATLLARELLLRPDAGFCVVGCCRPDQATSELDPRKLCSFDAVAVSNLDRHDWVSVRGLLRGSAVELLARRTALGSCDGLSAHPVQGTDLVWVREESLAGSSRVVKHVCEWVLAAGLLVAVLPVLLLSAAAVRVSSRGPALFTQVRIGRGGRPFTMWKLRTMRVTAEDERPLVLHLNEHDGMLFKIRRDPRTTAVGRVLRRFSIDELPQIWNVLRGDMALVGPRPPLPDEVAQYSLAASRRLLVKPGLTGLWQVSGRADLPSTEGVELDLDYVENWSLTRDLGILLRTVGAVVRGRGAY